MSRADLFVVCKNPECGEEVSPYITECPYCGARLRKRAPKLDRGRPRERPARLAPPSLGRLRRNEIPGIRADSPPYTTAVIVIATCVIWILTRGGYLQAPDLVVAGPVHNEWWRLVTSQFTYFFTTAASPTGTGVYQFVCLLTIAVFGWLLERRHGGLVVAMLFLLGGAGGALVASVLDTQAVVAGANGAALALLCAWAVPDLLARRGGEDYDGDLLGAGAFALVLLAMPIARPEANAVAGGVGVIVGYLVGLGLVRFAARR
ncbi:MAG: rhomboid family intramembrane serine protease [Solirubrobacteraceae bacterium]